MIEEKLTQILQSNPLVTGSLFSGITEGKHSTSVWAERTTLKNLVDTGVQMVLEIICDYPQRCTLI